jgi:hypothetical protein
MLAINPGTTRGVRLPALSLTSIASMLAPTVGLVVDRMNSRIFRRSEHARD